MASAYQESGDARGTFLGHPKGLFVLFFAEMWERFSYYGMRALLIFYLTKHWLFSDSESGIIYGAYTALVYITPVVGGYLADRYLGQRKAVLFGAVLLTAGHFFMAIEGNAAVGHINNPAISVFWLALALIIVGSGFLKANISVIVGQLYPRTRPGRFFRLCRQGGAAEPLSAGSRRRRLRSGHSRRPRAHGQQCPAALDGAARGRTQAAAAGRDCRPGDDRQPRTAASLATRTRWTQAPLQKIRWIGFVRHGFCRQGGARPEPWHARVRGLPADGRA